MGRVFKSWYLWNLSLKEMSEIHEMCEICGHGGGICAIGFSQFYPCPPLVGQVWLLSVKRYCFTNHTWCRHLRCLENIWKSLFFTGVWLPLQFKYWAWGSEQQRFCNVWWTCVTADHSKTLLGRIVFWRFEINIGGQSMIQKNWDMRYHIADIIGLMSGEEHSNVKEIWDHWRQGNK